MRDEKERCPKCGRWMHVECSPDVSGYWATDYECKRCEINFTE